MIITVTVSLTKSGIATPPGKSQEVSLPGIFLHCPLKGHHFSQHKGGHILMISPQSTRFTCLPKSYSVGKHKVLRKCAVHGRL